MPQWKVNVLSWVKGKYIVKIIAVGDRIRFQEAFFSFLQAENSLIRKNQPTSLVQWLLLYILFIS